jgi:acyl carrier protein
MTIQEKLISAFAAGLGVPASTQITTFEYRRIPQWDSMAHMQLVLEIETAFDIMLETDEVLDLSSFDKAVEIVSRHGCCVADAAA